MGIPGLTRMVEPIMLPVILWVVAMHKVVGVDVSVWIHTFAAVFAKEVEEGNCDSVVAAIRERAQRLRERGVTLVFVFDGACPPAKADEKARRAEIRRKASQLRAQGATQYSEIPEAASNVAWNARERLQKVVHAALVADGIPCFIAPFEADHNLVYLFEIGRIQFVLTVDSDLIAMGVPVLVCVHFPTGSAKLVDPARVVNAPEDARKRSSLLAFMYKRFIGDLVLLASFSRSDYLRIDGIGLKTAVRVFSEAAPATPIVLSEALKLVDGMHAAHARWCASHPEKSTLLSKEQVSLGVNKSFVAFTCAIVYDPWEGRECRLDGAAPTRDTVAITGAPAPRDLAQDFSVGRRVRSAPDVVTECYPRYSRVLCRDEAEPCDVQYHRLEKHVVQILEMPQEVVDRKSPWPADIPSDARTLLDVFRSVTETGRSHLKTPELKESILTWISLHREERNGDDSECSDDEDIADADRDARPRFRFRNCIFRHPDGRTALTEALGDGRVFLPMSQTIAGRWPAEDQPWLHLADWDDHPDRIPRVDVANVNIFYADMYRGQHLKGAFKGKVQRPNERAKQRVMRLTAPPRIRILRSKTDTESRRRVYFLEAHVPASKTAGGSVYAVRLMIKTDEVECMEPSLVTAPAAAPAALDAHAPAPAAAPAQESASPVVCRPADFMVGVRWSACPCKQQWLCAHRVVPSGSSYSGGSPASTSTPTQHSFELSRSVSAGGYVSEAGT